MPNIDTALAPSEIALLAAGGVALLAAGGYALQGGAALVKETGNAAGSVVASVVTAPITLGQAIGDVTDALLGTPDERRTKRELLDRSVTQPGTPEFVARQLHDSDLLTRQTLWAQYVLGQQDQGQRILTAYRVMYNDVLRDPNI